MLDVDNNNDNHDNFWDSLVSKENALRSIGVPVDDLEQLRLWIKSYRDAEAISEDEIERCLQRIFTEAEGRGPDAPHDAELPEESASPHRQFKKYSLDSPDVIFKIEPVRQAMSVPPAAGSITKAILELPSQLFADGSTVFTLILIRRPLNDQPQFAEYDAYLQAVPHAHVRLTLVDNRSDSRAALTLDAESLNGTFPYPMPTEPSNVTLLVEFE